MFDDLLDSRTEFLKGTREARAEKRENLLLENLCESDLISTESPLGFTPTLAVSPSPSNNSLLPTPQIRTQLEFPFTVLVKSTIERFNKQFVNTGTKEQRYVSSLRSPYRRQSFYQSSPTLKPRIIAKNTLNTQKSPVLHNYIPFYFSDTTTESHRTRRKVELDGSEANEINVYEIGELTDPALIAKSLANSYRLFGRHVLNIKLHMATELLDIILDDLHTLTHTKTPNTILEKYVAKVVNTPDNTFYALSSISNGDIQVFSNRSTFHRYTPLYMCAEEECAKLDLPDVYILENTELKCEKELSIYGIDYCHNLEPEYCMYAKLPNYECSFVGAIKMEVPYKIIAGTIHFLDRRRVRQKEFYMNDKELRTLLDIVFPFSKKFGGFLNSLVYKAYMFSIHILLMIFLTIKGTIKLIKWIKKRIVTYSEAKKAIALNKERERFEKLRIMYAKHPSERDKLNFPVSTLQDALN